MSTSRHVALNETGLALQLLVVAMLPVLNTIVYDWDVGMVVGLLVAECLLVLLFLPLLWTALDYLRQRHQRMVVASDHASSDLKTAVQPRFFLLRRLVLNSLSGLLLMGVGGLLPVMLLSVSAPQWMDWTGNQAVTEYAVWPVLTLFLWPFLLAIELWGEWPSYTLSLLLVCLIVIGQMLGLLWQGLTRNLDPEDLESESLLMLSLVSVPLFIMAGVAFAISAGFVHHRELSGPLQAIDVTLWGLVILVLLRSILAALTRRAQIAGKAWRQQGGEGGRNADRAFLRGVLVAVVVVLALSALAFAFSVPKRQPVPDMVALENCISQWPGSFAARTRAQLDPAGEGRHDATEICALLARTESLKLTDIVEPEDLARFQWLRVLELEGPAKAHAEDLHRLPALRRISFTRPGTLDARQLDLPSSIDSLIVSEGQISHAEALWNQPHLDLIALSDVELVDTLANRGRTRVKALWLAAVSGDLTAFMSGSLGIRELRLRAMNLEREQTRRLYWVRRLEVDAEMGNDDYCRLIEGLYSVRGARARACGRRFAIPD